MSPIRRNGTTRVLNAPPGWDADQHGPCQGLPVIDFDGVMYSYWKPTWRERLQVLCGRPVRLAVVGAGHPPVALDTEAS